MNSQVELVETDESSGWIEDSVVVVHGQHEAASECVAIKESYCWHGVTVKLCRLAMCLNDLVLNECHKPSSKLCLGCCSD